MDAKFYSITPELNERFKEALLEKGYRACHACGAQPDLSGARWNNSSTEAGTPLSMVQIVCPACDDEVVFFHSWYPGIESLEKLCEIVEGHDLDEAAAKIID
jgi:hypothetical protein